MRIENLAELVSAAREIVPRTEPSLTVSPIDRRCLRRRREEGARDAHLADDAHAQRVSSFNGDPGRARSAVPHSCPATTRKSPEENAACVMSA